MNVEMLGIDDSKTTCDCCGKSNLKRTVALDIDGDIQYYVVNCAAATLGFTDKTYSARDASQLMSKYTNREKVRVKIHALKLSADAKASGSGETCLVISRKDSSGTHYSVTSQEDFFRRNQFVPRVVYTASPTNSGSQDKVA